MRNIIINLAILSALLQSCVSYCDLISEGKAYYDDGHKGAAQNSFEKALMKDSSRADAYYGIGLVLADQCRAKYTGCESAINYFSQVIKIDSNFRHAFYNRANCFIELGRYKEALHDLNTTFSIAKEDADYFGNRSICYLKLGDTLNAMSSYGQAVLINIDKQSDFMDRLFQEYKK